MTLADLVAAHADAAARLAMLRGALRRLRPSAIDQAGKEAFDTLADESKAIRRFPHAEQQRIRAELHAEVETQRRAGAGVAMAQAATVRAVIADARAAIDLARRDVTRTLPTALNHIDAGDMVNLALYRETVRAALRTESVGALLGRYRQALQRADAAAVEELALIETHVASVTLPAETEADLESARQLRELIEGVQELRVPVGVPDFDALEADVVRLNGRAQELQIQPLNPEHDLSAREAFESELASMREAGAASDAEDHRARREAMAS